MCCLVIMRTRARTFFAERFLFFILLLLIQVVLLLYYRQQCSTATIAVLHKYYISFFFSLRLELFRYHRRAGGVHICDSLVWTAAQPTQQHCDWHERDLKLNL